jgi:hypothetical protein
MKITIGLDIEVSEDEDLEAVLDSYFKNQSHLRGRKVLGFVVVEPKAKNDFVKRMAAAKAKKRDRFSDQD